MIWLTWRQFRAQAVVTAAILAVLAVLLLVTGLHLAALYRGAGVTGCAANRDCAQMATGFLQSLAESFYRALYIFGAALLLIVPAVIGIFWGAPLIAKELESGTFRLAWNQSVTRDRWLTAKIGILGLTSMATPGLLSLMLGWWAAPIDKAAILAGPGTFAFGRFNAVMFDVRGVVPLGFAAFAFALGVLVGLVVRRTVPAMAITLAVFAAVQIVMPLAIRPHLITPVRDTTVVTASVIQGIGTTNPAKGSQTSVFAAAPNLPGAWIYSNQVVTASGSTSLGSVPQACQGQGFQSCASALAQMHLKQVVVYQPADRYWTFQWLELGIFLTIAVLLAWGCYWWVRRRLS